MKFRIIFFFILINFVEDAHAITQEQIIEAHIKAIGGLENWNKLKTITLKGIRSNESDVITFTNQIKINHSIRIDYKIKTRLNDLDGKNFNYILTPTHFSQFTPDSLFQDGSTIEATKQVIEQEMDVVDPFINASKKNIKITQLGDEFYEDQNHYKFSIVFPYGKNYYCYINEKDMMIDRMVLVSGELEEQIEYHEYEKQKNGIVIPKYIIKNETEKRYTSIEINPKFDESIFIKK